ncbi:MAG TPA: YncE family protein [Gemmatimonadales bacterium]|nr:YncE family protein [Gemmatimonadales bacterium]
MPVFRVAFATGLLAIAAGCASQPEAPGDGSNADLVGVEALTHPTLTSITSTPVSTRPYGIAVSAQNLVYVTQISGSSVVQARLPSVIFGNPITTGIVPAHVAFNPAGTRGYVTNQTGQSLSIIDVASSTEIVRLPLQADGFNLIVSKNGAKVYVTLSTGLVDVVSTSSNTVTKSIQLGPVTNGLALNPSGSLVFISSRDAGTVSVINTTNDFVVGTLVTGGMPQRMAVSPDGTELYIANETLGLDIWSLKTRTRITTVPMQAYGLGMTPDGVHLYVTDPLGGNIRVVNRVTRALVTTLSVGGTPRNVAFNKGGSAAFITNEVDFVTVVR